jgi:hypothetical protein
VGVVARLWPCCGRATQPRVEVIAFPQLDRWGGQDLNLRPTDYESASGRFVDLRRWQEPILTWAFDSWEHHVGSCLFAASRGFLADYRLGEGSDQRHFRQDALRPDG